MIALQTYSIAQTAVTSAIPIFSPLIPALTVLNTQIAAAQSQLTSITAPMIETTKSKTVSIGGEGDGINPITKL
jgi:hypothetical protein